MKLHNYISLYLTNRFIQWIKVFAFVLALHAFFATAYNSALRADFIRSVMPHVPYKSLEDLTNGILSNKIELMTGDSFRVILKLLEISPKENWKELNEALRLRPFVTVSVPILQFYYHFMEFCSF